MERDIFIEDKTMHLTAELGLNFHKVSYCVRENNAKFSLNYVIQFYIFTFLL